MKRFFAIFLILSILVSIIPAGFAEASFFSDPVAIEHAADSVVMLTCYDSDGKPFASGSGFAAFDAGVIVTNYHVIEGDVAAVQAHTEAGLYFDINEVLCYDIVSDIAILKTNARIGLDLLETGSSSLLKGSRVVAIGSPQGFMNTVSEGIYSGIYILDTEYLLFSASISAGSSGGALFNEDGKVIGITSATWTEGQNLNLAVPIEKVEALWDSYKNGTYVEPKEQAEEVTQPPVLEEPFYPQDNDDTKRVYSDISEFLEDLETVTDYQTGMQEIETYLAGTEYYKEAIQQLKAIVYKKAINQYNDGQLLKAETNFTALGSYKDAKKYLILVNAKYFGKGLFAESWNELSDLAYKDLLDILSFADAKDVMIHCFPEHFLKGTWKTSSGKYYFKLKKKNENLQASYSLPYKDLSNAYFSFDDGVYVLSNKSKSKDVFKFTIIDKNTVKVYCYKNGKTYTMYRQ